jgi:chaperonin GroEL
VLVQTSEVLARLYSGFVQMAEPLAHTLGPSQHLVMNTSLLDKDQIEFLTNSATIATRIIELPDRHENVGAMALRAMVQKMHERYGDGAATAAVLAREILGASMKLLAAGFNPVMLRRGMECGVEVAIRALAEQAQPLQDEEEALVRLASSVTGNQDLGSILGEIFTVLGENTSLLTEEHPAPFLDREYISGGQWAATPGSYMLIPDGKAALELKQPLIFLTDDNLETLEQVQPALEQAVAFPGKPPLLVIARHVLGPALNVLITNHTRGVLTVGIAFLQTGVTDITDDLEDMALLTGGQVTAKLTGRPPESMKPEYFGRARKVTLTRKNLLIVDGAGNPQSIRQRITQVRAQLKSLPRDEEAWQKQRLRLGRLSGGIGVVKIGAYTAQERALLIEQAELAIHVLDTAMEEGVVPGGGVAYLNCISAVEAAAQASASPDVAAGIQLVAQALEAPFLQIIRNQGHLYPPLALDEARRRGPAYGFDAQRGEFCSMTERGILDGLAVVRAALQSATSLAAMLMTIDAIILRD